MTQWGSIRGLRGFFVAFAGQIISTIGSAITSFGVSIWLFQQTGQASSLTWASAAYLAPLLLISPLAGTFVDRHNRKKIMIGTDAVAGLTTVIMLLLLRAGALEAWHIFALNALNGFVAAFQWPAFAASVTLMVDKEQYGRTSGFMQLGDPIARVVAPAAAAALLAAFNFELLLWLDIITFLFAVATLWVVVVPQPDSSAEINPKESFLQASKRGFTFLLENRDLLNLQLILMGLNLGTIFGVAVLIPMILVSTGNNEALLATARACAAAGGIAGGLILGAWGGPKDRMRMVLGSMGGVALFGILYGVANGVVGWAVAGFFSQLCSAFVNSNARAIWQRKIPPALQGRVFSVQGLISAIMFPIVTAMAGPLADRFFEPAMQSNGALVDLFGWLVGTSAGSGMSLMIVLGSTFSLGIAAFGLFSTRLRLIETRVPDYDDAAGVMTD